MALSSAPSNVFFSFPFTLLLLAVGSFLSLFISVLSFLCCDLLKANFSSVAKWVLIRGSTISRKENERYLLVWLDCVKAEVIRIVKAFFTLLWMILFTCERTGFISKLSSLTSDKLHFMGTAEHRTLQYDDWWWSLRPPGTVILFVHHHLPIVSLLLPISSICLFTPFL